MNFLDRVEQSLQDHPPVKKWFYISERWPNGSFAGAIIIEEANSIAAAMRGGEQMDNDGAELGTYTEIPDDKLPAEQYRNRKLTKEEVEKLWG